MWSPSNKNELPSPEEIKYAKEAIFNLENALRDAFGLLESTKLRIAEMRRDLEERKGWIAPIRKVPTEILADILLYASEMANLAPVRFSAVSRVWRSIILATPKAWSFIHLRGHYSTHVRWRNNEDYHGYFPGYKKTYFERSKPRLLHLSLPDMEGFHPKHSDSILREQSHRIQCLTAPTHVLSATRSARECQEFPYLEILTLANEGEGENLDTSFFTISRFPALQTLRWPRCFPLTSTSPTISPSFFPPLQNLSLAMAAISSIDILQSCAATLKALVICYEGLNTSTAQINFPLLRYLAITSPSLEGCPPLVKAITPALTSLEVVSQDSSFPGFFDADMQHVTHMRWNAFKFPSLCTHVRVLQIMVNPDYIASRSGGYADCANNLKELACVYPSLERIELSNEKHGRLGTGLMQQKVEECLGNEFVKPNLLWTSSWKDDLPGEILECGLYMPCNE